MDWWSTKSNEVILIGTYRYNLNFKVTLGKTSPNDIKLSMDRPPKSLPNTPPEDKGILKQALEYGGLPLTYGTFKKIRIVTQVLVVVLRRRCQTHRFQ